MVKGLLADINAIGHVEALLQKMTAEPWAEFWIELGLVLMHFDELGLSPDASDLVIWQTCQREQLVLITDNRNQDDPESLEATIRQHNQTDSLPVFTIADLAKFQSDHHYADRVLKRLFDQGDSARC